MIEKYNLLKLDRHELNGGGGQELKTKLKERNHFNIIK